MTKLNVLLWRRSYGVKPNYSLCRQAISKLQLTRSRLFRYLVLFFLGLFFVVTLAACNAVNAVSGGGEPAPLRVALDPTFPPFQWKAANGKFEGFDIDLINAIAEAEGLKLDLQPLSFDIIIPAMRSGAVDLTISTMTITPERTQQVDFSHPYFKSGQAIAVRDATTNINSYQDLKGKKIAVQISTVGAELADAAQPEAVRKFEDTPLALQALIDGKVDAVISDAPVILYAIQNGGVPGIKVTGDLITEEYYGIAFPKDSPILEKINTSLTTLIENGQYRQIYQKWFGGEPPQLPETG